MNKIITAFIGLFLLHICYFTEAKTVNQYKIRLLANNEVSIGHQGIIETFSAKFVILYSKKDPKLEYKNLREYSHFAPSWLAKNVPAEKMLFQRGENEASGGDGVDKNLDISKDARTFDVFYSAEKSLAEPVDASEKDGIIEFKYEEQGLFSFSASLKMDQTYHVPVFTFKLDPKTDGFYSVGYVGAPKIDEKICSDIWQPFVWKQKLFPDQSYLTPAFLCPLPATLVHLNDYTFGVVVPPFEFPFQPLPTQHNNLFGVSLRAMDGKASPMAFAPVLGQMKSKMKKGDHYSFSISLFLEKDNLMGSFETIATGMYGFRDYRNNEISTVNQVIDRMVDYNLSKYANFIDSLRGCSYATDVPGSVKNVSSLNPLEIALLTDNREMYEKRVLPVLEFMLSRDKTLFSLETKIKTQNPSRKMGGPCACPSELAVLYEISGKKMPLFMSFLDESQKKAESNLKSNWFSSVSLYHATNDQRYLDAAESGAKSFASTVGQMKDLGSWDNLTKMVQMVDMYETTGDKTYLDAAQKEARVYAMQSWFCPQIPDEKILVNKDGKAPIYWYLSGRGFSPQFASEETVPAWRLSEIGLLPESTVTCIGHRGVFMAQHAPVFLRIAQYTNDDFLRSIARSAILGRYRNFPGYHLNTDRSTAYEQLDFPLHKHQNITVTSMHYNHIMVMISNLFDYLVSDVSDRSRGKISFGTKFIEGYGYLSNRFYGYDQGEFYNYKNLFLWMPQKLLQTSSVELNYIAARDSDNLFFAFTNQLKTEEKSAIELNTRILPQLKNKSFEVEIYRENKKAGTSILKNGVMNIQVAAKGITAIVIKNVKIKPSFQDEILNSDSREAWSKDRQNLAVGNSSALLLNMGNNLRNVYVYLRDDDSVVEKVDFSFENEQGVHNSVTDKFFPFEFQIKLNPEAEKFKGNLTVTYLDGTQKREDILLYR